MAIRCECAQCKTEFWAPDKFAGRAIGCPVCEARVSVPGTAPESAEPAAPAQPQPLLDILDEEAGILSQGPGATGSRQAGSPLPLEHAWASDGTWQGIGRGSRRRAELPISLQAGIAVFTIGALVVYGMTILAAPKLAELLGYLLLIAGIATVLAGWCWEAMFAMRESTSQGIWVIVNPFYTLYFLLTRWEKTWKPFVTVLVGAGVVGGAIYAVQYAKQLIAEREGTATAAGGPEVAAAGKPTQKGVPPGRPSPPSVRPGAASTVREPQKSESPLATQPSRPIQTAETRGTPLGPISPPGAAASPVGPAAVPAPFPQPEVDAALSPVERAYEEGSREYAVKAAVDLLAGDDASLRYRVRWFQAGKRPTIGLRWGLGVEASDTAAPLPKDAERFIGSVSLALVSGLEKRMAAGAFGEWPDSGDPRFRQVAILKSGTRSQLLAAARRRRLDILAVLQLTRLSSATGQVTQTLVQVQIADVVGDQALWTSQAFGGIAPAPSARPGEDPTGARAAEVLAYVGTYCELRPMPTLTAEQVRSRLEQMESEKVRPENRLPILVELRYYQLQQLVPVDDVAKRVDAILGTGSGRLLATGQPVQRREAVEAWLKKAFP